MPNQIEQVPWNYPLVNTTQSKRTNRTGCPADRAYDLIGVDGSLHGGQRPFMGMRFERDLTGVLVTDSTHTVSGTQTIADHFPIQFRIDATQYAGAHLYRVKDEAGWCKIFLEYRRGTEASWVGPVDLVGWKTHGDKVMDVQVVGRFVYVYVQGETPFVFYIRNVSLDLNDRETACVTPTTTTTSPAPDYELIIITDPGPGPTISLKGGDPLGIMAAENGVAFLTPEASPTNGEDATARVLFFGFSNRNVNTVPLDDGTTGGDPIIGPSVLLHSTGPDVKVWCSPPQANPSFRSAKYVRPGPVVNTGDVDGDAPPVTKYTRAGWLWKEGNRRFGDPVPIVKGRYTFAIQLFDSRTGRRSNLSTKYSVAPPELAYGAVIGAAKEGTVVRQETKGVLTYEGVWYNDFYGVTFPAIDIIYDRNKYDTLIVYRSTRYDETQPTSSSTVRLFTEAQVPLIDYHTDVQPSAGSNGEMWRRSIYFNRLLDKELALQPEYVNDISYEETMPAAGCALFYEGIMLFGNSGEIQSNSEGLGRVKWSEPGQLSVELVAPLNDYPLENPSEEILSFKKAGPNVIALTDQSAYLGRKQSLFVQFYPLHTGFGTTGSRTSEVVGSFNYYLTHKGLKMLTSDGALENVETFDKVIVEDWVSDLDDVQMAFDPVMSALFIHNPAQSHTLVMWFNSNRVTELFDMTFKHVRRGPIPYDYTDVNSRLQERAVFVSEVRPTSSTYVWRVWTVDYARRRGNTRLLDITGDARFTIASKTTVSDGGTDYTKVTFSSGTVGTRIEGAYLYLLDGANAHKKARVIRKVDDDEILLDKDEADIMFHGFDAEDITGLRAGLSPVYFRWTGAQLGLQVETEEQVVSFGSFEFFRGRQAETLLCCFSTVSGTAASDTTNNDARFAALIFKGNEEDIVANERRFPEDINGNKMVSVANGPSIQPAAYGTDKHGYCASILFPGVEIVCPDLDFTLLAVRITGNILASFRDERQLVGATG